MSTVYVKTKKKDKKKHARRIGIIFVGIGVLLFFYFLYPVIFYQVFLARAFSDSDIEVPVPKYMVAKKGSNITTLVSQGLSNLTTDYTDARNWYQGVAPSAVPEVKKNIESYSLSIPKLKIENAEVSTIDYDLSKHLVQYFGTVIPGEKGTAIVFGHSTIPAWFDAKNYKTIFATLHTIKMGDEVIVTVEGKKYTYKVFSIQITEADDTNMFSQSYDNSYLTVVTCTPPGTIWKRLVVRASII